VIRKVIFLLAVFIVSVVFAIYYKTAIVRPYYNAMPVKKARALATRLRKEGTLEAAKRLVMLTGHPSPDVRMFAVSPLSSFDTEEIRLALMDRLDDEITFIRFSAAQSLGLLHERRAIPRLLNMLDSQSGDVVCASMFALGLLGEKKAVEPIIPMLSCPERGIRESAAKALGDIGDKRAIEPLNKLLEKEKDKYTVPLAKNALLQIGDTTYEKEVLNLLPQNGYVNLWVARSMTRTGRIEGAQRLVEHLLDKECSVRAYIMWREMYPAVSFANLQDEENFVKQMIPVAKWLVENTFNGKLVMPEAGREKR
jgi:HEAT repeat protein